MASLSYRIGALRIDPACRELWHGDEEVSLPPKAFGCLVYLVEHRDRAVGRDELIDAVWGKENLADSVLGHAIVAVRRALDDTGEEQRYIKTVQGFGYRWVAPVEVTEEAEAGPAASGGVSMRRRPLWPWIALGALAIALLGLATSYLRRESGLAGIPSAAWQWEEGDVALLLPVTVEPEEHHGWMRFGVMELISERLRAAGQPMVPSETVIALMHGLPAEPAREDLERLTSVTGAQLVLGARVEPAREGWRVSLRNLDETSQTLTAFAEAEDVLDAARAAADRLALSLGLTPAPEPDAEPGLTMLLRQTDAAILAQQMDLARELIETAEPELRQQPEVRLHQGLIDYHSYDLDAAQVTFESLLDEPALVRDPVLLARVLHGLGGVHFQRGDHGAAKDVLQEATAVLGQSDALAVLGTIQRGLGAVTLMRGELVEARVYMAQARKAIAATGDSGGLAILDNNLGVLEALHERHTEALSYFESAASLHATLNNLGEELRARSNIVDARLRLLEPQTAAAAELRLRELLAQATNPRIAARADVAMAALLAALGKLRAAEETLAAVMPVVESRDDLLAVRAWALVLRAEQRARHGRHEEAARDAAEVVDEVLLRDDILLDDHLGRAWLVLLRARLWESRLATAREIASSMIDWSNRSPTQVSNICAALAQAEVAAATGESEAAEEAFERALSLTDSGQAPARLLQVAESYVLWLLSARRHDTESLERALVLADRLARHADQDYGAALLRLRVYHALGPPSAWRAALTRARVLAGERQIPEEFLVAPQTT